MNSPDYFSRDHIVRDEKNRPIGRAVLKNDFKPHEDLQVVVLKIPVVKVKSKTIFGMIIYINKEPYYIPKDLPKSKLASNKLDHRLGLFVLQYIGDKKDGDKAQD